MKNILILCILVNWAMIVWSFSYIDCPNRSPHDILLMEEHTTIEFYIGYSPVRYITYPHTDGEKVHISCVFVIDHYEDDNGGTTKVWFGENRSKVDIQMETNNLRGLERTVKIFGQKLADKDLRYRRLQN